jgi:hypothetical protein
MVPRRVEEKAAEKRHDELALIPLESFECSIRCPILDGRSFSMSKNGGTQVQDLRHEKAGHSYYNWRKGARQTFLGKVARCDRG